MRRKNAKSPDSKPRDVRIQREIEVGAVCTWVGGVPGQPDRIGDRLAVVHVGRNEVGRSTRRGKILWIQRQFEKVRRKPVRCGHR